MDSESATLAWRARFISTNAVEGPLVLLLRRPVKGVRVHLIPRRGSQSYGTSHASAYVAN